MSGQTQEQRLLALSARLSERDHAIIRDVVNLRFVSSGQVGRLHFDALTTLSSRQRITQRRLAALVEHGLLTRLGRRVGGVRSGSRGFVNAPTAEAKRLVAFWSGQGISRTRNIEEPGQSFVEHAVAVSEIYVQLHEAQRDGLVELLEHQAEPNCWRIYPTAFGGTQSLRPDAFVALGVGELEHRSFVEIDRGTEGSTALRRKLRSYVEYWNTGREQHAHGVFPRVVWLTNAPARIRLLNALIAELPDDARRLFSVCPFDRAVDVLRGGVV